MLKPLPTHIYRETTRYRDGRHSTRQTFDPKKYESWKALYAEGLPTFIEARWLTIGEITWKENRI